MRQFTREVTRGAVSAGFATSLCALALGVATASAQPGADDAATVLEEITVTARRRTESLQDAPFAVTAFTAQAIEDAGINRMEDFVALTSNVTLATSQGIGTSFLSIRGLTQVRNGEAPVATIVDGVLQFSGIQFRQELFDIEGIEVVKGPQGALYGRNATGGAIIINTKRPGNETEGYVTAGVGAGSEYVLEGSIGGALVENKLFGQISGKRIDREGYLYNITRQEKADRFENTALRGRLIWEPTDTLSFDLRASVSRHKGRGIGFQYQAVNIADDGVTATGFGSDTGPIDANNVLPIRDNNVDYGERDMDDFALKIDWETELGTLISTTSFTDIEEWNDSDQFPYTAAMSSPALFGFDGTQTGFFDVEAWSQEIRFRSPDDQAVRWEVGAYYLEWDRFVSLSTGVDTGAGIIRLEREPTTDPRNPTTSFLADDNSNTARAVFGNVSMDLSEAFELSLALRYDEEERVQDVSPLQFPAGQPGARNKETFDMLQPKVTLRYVPEAGRNYYVTWGRGFRSGQFNQNGISEVAASVGLLGVNDVADQEESESFEIGYKGLYVDDRLRVTASAFATKVEGQQFFSFIGAISAQILTNIDEVQLYGGELEFAYAANDYLDLYAAVGVTESEIEEYVVDPSSEGNDAPYIAGTTFNVGGQYEYPLNVANANLFARVDYERRGSQYWDVQNSSDRDALDFVTLRVGLVESDEAWSVMAEVQNALDEEYNSEWVAGGFSARAPGRIWNLKLRYNF